MKVERNCPTVSGYRSWLKSAHNEVIDDRYETYYDHVTSKVKADFEKSDFWVQLCRNLGNYDQEYQVKNGYPLLIPNFRPELLSKSFESFLIKTYRKNILENKAWPAELDGGWILPTNWFSRINDIVRTLFVVKYLDGVGFVKDKIASLCKEKGMNCEAYFEAREEGYYAAHLYTKQSFEIPKTDWDTERVGVSVEIQVTTQLQEVIRRLLHRYYERRRRMVSKPLEKWQWDYKCEEFGANYLGHILHYVEGMIMEIREKQKAATA